MATRSSSVPSIERPTVTSQEVSDMSVALANQVRLMKSMKSVYQADQQAKLLNLQADVESLLLQLKSLKQQQPTPDLELVVGYDKENN
ncbi:MAG TPA: hypothetical protein V6D28_29680 [Leptolyngbyaceae cyanobacterium]